MVHKLAHFFSQFTLCKWWHVYLIFKCNYFVLKIVSPNIKNLQERSIHWLFAKVERIFLCREINLQRKICRWGGPKNIVLIILWSVSKSAFDSVDLKFEGWYIVKWLNFCLFILWVYLNGFRVVLRHFKFFCQGLPLMFKVTL